MGIVLMQTVGWAIPIFLCVCFTLPCLLGFGLILGEKKLSIPSQQKIQYKTVTSSQIQAPTLHLSSTSRPQQAL